MPNFERLYYQLFAAIADAVEHLEQGETPQAKECLISAMQKAEQQFLDDSETE